MTSMKSMVVAVLDTSSTMAEPVSTDNGKQISKLTTATSFLNQFIVQKLMTTKTLEFGCVAFGNEETSNYLNETSEGYEFCNEIIEMDKLSVQIIPSLNSISPSNPSIQADIINGIIVGQDILNRINESKTFNRIMIIITDGETPVVGVEDLEVIIKNMNKINNFGLYILHIGTIKSNSSKIKVENAKLFQSMVDIVPTGKYLEADTIGNCFHILSMAPGLGTRPQMLKNTLELTPHIKVPCSFFSKIMKAKLPTLKKRPRNGGEGSVKRDTTYRNPQDPDLELGIEERVKGYKYGSQYFPTAATIEEQFKIDGIAEIKLIGFMNASKVPRHHFLEAPISIIGNVDVMEAQLFMSAFIENLRQSSQVGLVRFVKKENADPYLGAIMPSDDINDNMSLLLHRLPCKEDMRDYSFPPLTKYETVASNESEKLIQKNALSRYVDFMTIRDPHPAAITPINPTFHEIMADIVRRVSLVVDPNTQIARIPFQDPLYIDQIHSNSQHNTIVANVRQVFPLVKDEKRSKKSKTYFTNIDIKTSSEANNTSMSGMRVNISENMVVDGDNDEILDEKDALDSLPSFIEATISPIEDMTARIAMISELHTQHPTVILTEKVSNIVTECMNTMRSVIERAITMGQSAAYYKRAVQYLQYLRTCAIENHQSILFNNILTNIKNSYQYGRHKAVWSLLVEERLSLISNNEEGSSDVSVQDADLFLKESDNVQSQVASTAIEVDEDDLFGGMA
eukprot:gene8952-12072_t